jgi:hypothetical protein
MLIHRDEPVPANAPLEPPKPDELPLLGHHDIVEKML